MTIMKAQDNRGGAEEASPEAAADGKEKSMFSADGLEETTDVDSSKTSTGSVPGLLTSKRNVSITPEEKAAFIDSVVNNSRFELEYSLFGGKVTLTVRSLTSEEIQALATWTVKQSVANPSDQMAGRHRKYILAAQVSRFNGVDMPPLEQPLFETLDKDGKTVHEPGWVKRSSFWDSRGSGVIVAVMGCLEDFDLKYSTLCSKAKDANFWSPDTP